MGNLSKITSLLLSFLLLYTSIKVNLYTSPTPTADTEIVSAFTEGKPNLFCLSRQTESAITFNLSLNLDTTDRANDHSQTGYYFEQKLANVASKYLFYIRAICPGLSIKDIIFPFHYFW
jgi:hypothetical protein